MLHLSRIVGPFFSLLFVSPSLFAQTSPPVEPIAPPKSSTLVAATVNGQAIPEAAVERALQGIPSEDRGKARQEVLLFLVDNAIIDQYLSALKVTVDAKDVDQHLAQFKDEIKKHDQDFAIVLNKMKLTEADLKEQILNQLRWEKFVNQQATDAKLKALFDHMPEAFDGSSIRARHILLACGNDEASKQQALAQLKQIKDQIEKNVAAALAKLPADADNLTKEKQRTALLEAAFADEAKKHSTCSSKQEGGDLRWFPRYGRMVEPFAKAAFALKPYQISDVVASPFGYHLILVTGRKPGISTKYEDEKVKEAVKEVYEARLKEAVLAQMKPRAKIEFSSAK